jgi:4-hydroxy-tetrahydrodipicolinate reductase
MKIAVVGTGKTGNEVIRLLGANLHAAFNQNQSVSVEALKGSDAVIIFVPGESVTELIPIIKATKIPAVWGSTGFVWPQDLDEELNEDHIRWVAAANFSLGMQMLRKVLNLMGQTVPRLLPDAKLSIREVHHSQKKDKPSGTALTWQEWLGLDCKITSKRQGDVKGIHELTIKTPYEEISLRHEALDRAVFAEGAIWAAEYLIGYPTLPGGLYSLADLIDGL